MDMNFSQNHYYNLFATEPIEDVIVPGVADQESTCLKFHPMFWWIYIKFQSCYLRCEAKDQWHIKLDIVENILRDFDEDDFCTASLSTMCLLNPYGQKIISFWALLDEKSNLDDGLIKAGGFVLPHNEALCLEPSSDTGIRIGTKEQVMRWTSRLHFPMSNYRRQEWVFNHPEPINKRGDSIA